MVICSTSFVTLGRAQLKALGYADLPMAVIPHPFGTRTREQVTELARQCVGDIVQLALGAAGGTAGAAAKTGTHGAAPATSITMPDDIIAFNEECERRRWTDGLPLIPPTPDRVSRMLQGTRRAPTDVVAHIAPGFGVASVERIAINAVMAGCRPAYLPVLMAAVEAVADKRFNLQGIQATTNSATPFIVVNGPLAQELGLNAAVNCLGQGAWANATMGRALRLILQNIGGAWPGEMDRATHGQPGKYTFCCAENEAASPWAPLHAERGYASNDNVVTVIGAAGTLNMNTHTKNAQELLRVMADSIVYPTSNDYHFAGEPWVVISPEHAEVLHRGGLDKAAVKRQLWERSKMAASRYADMDFERGRHARGAELGGMTPDTLVPISLTPDAIGIIVAGGPGTHSVYVPTFGQTRAISRLVVCG